MVSNSTRQKCMEADERDLRSGVDKGGLMKNRKKEKLLSADLIGPYLRSKSGNQYVLVVVDCINQVIITAIMG